MIETARLQLIPCSVRHFEAILTDPKQLEQILGVTVYDDGFDFPGVASIKTMRSLYDQLRANPDTLGWWTYLFVHAGDRVLVGQGGYKGKPNEAGMVEIGYAIVPSYRRRSLATEAAQGLIDNAFAHEQVQSVEAHTLAERNPSTRVLERVGMRFVGTVDHPRLGEVWRWSVGRLDLRPS